MSWDRAEVPWQEATWERLDRDLRERAIPWHIEAVYGYLRHAERQFRHRGPATPRDPGPRYWTPRDVPGQVAADAKRYLPGRRALKLITGLEERECRRVLQHVFDWLDPRSIEEDEKAGRDPSPAGLRDIVPPSPDSRPPSPDSRPPDEDRSEVEPPAVSRVPTQVDTFGHNPPDRASISARVPQEQVQARITDLQEEIPGPPAPSEPAADPPRPVLVLTPPGEPAPKKTRKAPPPPPAAAPSYTPDQREALAAFKAIMSAFAGQPRCEWITRPADDERWLIELHAEIGDDTDMPEQFAKMRDWLDGELRRKQAGKSSKFPKSHQAFMRNWLKRATADPGPRHGIDRDRDPAYRGVPDGFEPPKEYRHVKFITPADIVDDPNRPF